MSLPMPRTSHADEIEAARLAESDTAVSQRRGIGPDFAPFDRETYLGYLLPGSVPRPCDHAHIKNPRRGHSGPDGQLLIFTCAKCGALLDKLMPPTWDGTIFLRSCVHGAVSTVRL